MSGFWGQCPDFRLSNLFCLIYSLKGSLFTCCHSTIQGNVFYLFVLTPPPPTAVPLPGPAGPIWLKTAHCAVFRALDAPQGEGKRDTFPLIDDISRKEGRPVCDGPKGFATPLLTNTNYAFHSLQTAQNTTQTTTVPASIAEKEINHLPPLLKP